MPPLARRFRRPPSRSEARTARLLRDANPDGIAAVQRDYGNALRGLISEVLGGREGADDVLQKVLVEAWQRGPSYDPERSSLFTWLAVIARSRAIDARRSRDRAPAIDHAAVVERVGVAEETDAVVERWRVAQLLRAIPSEEAELLRLRFYEGLSQSEIADAVGMPLGTVKLRMVQGLKRLRELVEHEEGAR